MSSNRGQLGKQRMREHRETASDTTIQRPSSGSGSSSSFARRDYALQLQETNQPGKVTIGVRHGRTDGSPEDNTALNSPPLCRCNVGASLRIVSKTNENHGRKFWVCGKPINEKCKFFEWDDQGRQASTIPILGKLPECEQPKKRQRPTIFANTTTLSISLESISQISCTMCDNVANKSLCAELREVSGCVTVPTSQLNSEKFLFPIKSMLSIQEAATRHSAKVLVPIPASILSRLQVYNERELRRQADGHELESSLGDVLPAIMREKLMKFQWDGIRFAISRGGRCLIGDDMGLGKTLQAIAVARIYRRDWPILIICPSSLRLNWKEELLHWLQDDIDEDEINVIMKGTECQHRLDAINIVSYDLVQKLPAKELKRCNFIIADESHYLKTMDSKRSKFVLPLIRQMRRALLLSGTPALSRPVELFPQISCLEPELFPSFNEYTERYCNAHMSRWGWDVNGASNLDELHKLMRGSCLIRRKKDEVLTQLPSKQRQVVWVETKSCVMKQLQKAQEELIEARRALESAASEEEALSCKNAERAVNNKMYSLTGEAKLDSIQQFLKDTLECSGKLIIFAHHLTVLLSLNDYLRTKLKESTILIDGNTPQNARQSLCNDFQSNANCRVAVLSITAAGVGLTLTAASQVLFAELYWNPGSLLQAEDRAHRIGQRDCVMVKYLLARNTLDESMWSTVRQKLFVVGKSLTGSAAHMAVTSGGSHDVKRGPLDRLLDSTSAFKHDEADPPRPPHYSPLPLQPSNDDTCQVQMAEQAGKATSSLYDDIFPLQIQPTKAPTDFVRQLRLDPDLALARSLHMQFVAKDSK